MAASELSIEAIHDYFIKNGGIIANHEVVKHFKPYLTNCATKEDARVKFRKYINTLATTRTDGDEKFLILRPKFSICPEPPSLPPTSPYFDPRNSLGIPVSPSNSHQNFVQNSPTRQPPPYRPPPPPPATPSPNVSFDNLSICSSNVSLYEQHAPQAPPRRRSSEKLKIDREVVTQNTSLTEPLPPENSIPESEKQSISVKERTQKFNRLASVEDELSPKAQKEKKKQTAKGADEDDGVSVTLLDQKKCTEWLVTAAKGDYQELAKLAFDEPRLAKLKDPFTAYTILHWGAKHGNEDIIKLFAGRYKVDVNSKTNGGYTPLHLAIQFGHKKVYNLLVEVYRANADIRDFSGRKPSQYKPLQMQAASKDTYSEYSMPKPNKHEFRAKHHSFLRKSFTPNQRRHKSAIETRTNSPTASQSRFYDTRLLK